MEGEERVDGWRVRKAGARNTECEFAVQGWNTNGNGKKLQGKPKRGVQGGAWLTLTLKS